MKLMIEQIKVNERITTFCGVESIQLKESKKKGREYLVVELSDKTGKIKGYLWDNPGEAQSNLKPNTIVKVRAIVNESNGTLLLNIEQIRTANESEIDIDDFFEIVPGGIDLWFDKLNSQIELIKDPDCRRLIDAFINDVKFIESFKIAPGGLLIHHSYRGGLLEHTTNAMELCALVADRDAGLLNRDVLVTGAFFHDIGKIREIFWDIVKTYTTEGKLLGHIVLGIRMLDAKISGIPNFPADLRDILLHMIASHHGSLEYGSPVRPATPEATALHMMEAADAKINHIYRHLMHSAPENDWSSYDKVLETCIYQKKYFKTLAGQTSIGLN